jgi:hypothetical protein
MTLYRVLGTECFTNRTLDIISQNRLPTITKATVPSVSIVPSVWLKTLGGDYMYQVPHQYPEYTLGTNEFVPSVQHFTFNTNRCTR